MAQSESFFLKRFLSERRENLAFCLAFQEERMFSRNFFLPLLFSFVSRLFILKILFWLYRKLLISSVCFHFSYACSVIFRLCCFLLVALPFAGERQKNAASFLFYASLPFSLPFYICATSVLPFSSYFLSEFHLSEF